jgi:hypothetical protein
VGWRSANAAVLSGPSRDAGADALIGKQEYVGTGHSGQVVGSKKVSSTNNLRIVPAQQVRNIAQRQFKLRGPP